MSDKAFTRLMLVLLLIICGCLLLLDQQRQRLLGAVRGEVDNLHSRMNAAGLLANIAPAAPSDQPVDLKSEAVFDPFAQFRAPPNPPPDASPLEQALTAGSNDQLSHIASEETQ